MPLLVYNYVKTGQLLDSGPAAVVDSADAPHRSELDNWSLEPSDPGIVLGFVGAAGWERGNSTS